MKFCGDHVAVAGVLHCGKREVSPRLELAERDAVLFAEPVQFINVQALGFRDKAELREGDLLLVSFFMATPLPALCFSAAIQEYNVAFGRCISSAMVPTDGHPGFFMRSRNASLMLFSTFDFLILSLFRPVLDG